MKFTFLFSPVISICSLLFLTACGGGGSGSDNEDPQAFTNTKLNITIAGLPTNGSADINVEGPDGFAIQVTQSTTLTDLGAGHYTLIAKSVIADHDLFDTFQTTRSINLTLGETGKVTFNYG